MPVYKCSNGKYRIGEGECIYDTKEKAEGAMAAMYAEMDKNMNDDGILNKKYTLCKSVDEEKRIFSSIALKANYRDDDGIWQDYWPEEVVEEAAYDFMLNCQKGNLQHIMNTDEIKVAESFIARSDFPMGDGEVNKGDWIVSFKILDDDLWDMCKKGYFTGLSVGCTLVDYEDEE